MIQGTQKSWPVPTLTLTWDGGESAGTMKLPVYDRQISRRHLYRNRSAAGVRPGQEGARMSMINRHPVMSYLIAAAGVVLAGLSPWWVTPLTGDTPPMRLMLVVVVGVSAWLGGLGPGLFATTMGLVAIALANDAPGDWASLNSRLIRFTMPSVAMSVVFKWLHASRRQAELKDQEFRRSVGRYRRLIETAGQGIWVISGSGKTTYANPRMGEILGMPPKQMIGRPLGDFLVDDDASWSESEDQPDPFACHEIRLRGGDGAVRHAIISSQRVDSDELPDEQTGDLPLPQEDAGSGGLLLMVTDVTPLKNVEAALREKESVLRSFYDSSQMAMGVVEVSTRDARFVSANTLTEKFLGVPTGRLEGKTARQLSAPPEMLKTWIERFRECRKTGQPVRFEYNGNCASSPGWVAATLSPMESVGSGRALCSFIVEDITDRKRTEADLLDAKELAEAASRAKDRFLAVLSHELRTPLTPVLIAVGSLLESKPDAPLLQTLEMIRRNIELEARLIDDLLDLSRIARGRLRLDLEIVDIHKLIRRAMEICRDETLIAGLHVLTDLKASYHHVTADHARIMQVVWNLIRNAAKFTPAGGTLTIRTINPPATPESPGEGDAGWLAIEFEDTGIGIDPQVLPRLFDPFEQGDADVRGRSGGLGLGLAISRSLAEALGGRLTASSPGRGQGSTFRLELKVVPQATRATTPRKRVKAPESRAPVIVSNNLRILLVEDNKDTLRYLATVLRKRGHQVVTADSFALALAAFNEAEAPFDVLISDIELPDGDGLQLMREIRSVGRMAAIAMSGFGAEEDLRQSREAGFFDHLTKPIDLTRLDNAIKSATATASGRETEADLDDESEPFSLRSDGNSSGAFRIVWSVEPKPENLEP
jgi:PAS domain S-box-containing protein